MGDGDSGSTSRRLSNKGCWLCHEVAVNVIHEMTWRNKWLPPAAAQVRDDFLCAGNDYGIPEGWEERTLFCSEDCRLHREIILFEKAIGIRN